MMNRPQRAADLSRRELHRLGWELNLIICGDKMDECACLRKQLSEIQEQLRVAVADKKQLKADNKALQEQLTSCRVGRQAQ